MAEPGHGSIVAGRNPTCNPYVRLAWRPALESFPDGARMGPSEFRGDPRGPSGMLNTMRGDNDGRSGRAATFAPVRGATGACGAAGGADLGRGVLLPEARRPA